jgi:hypothetical protein
LKSERGAEISTESGGAFQQKSHSVPITGRMVIVRNRAIDHSHFNQAIANLMTIEVKSRMIHVSHNLHQTAPANSVLP